MAIGLEIEPEELILYRGRDFKYTFRYVDESGSPASFPAGSLFFELQIADGEEPVTIWEFEIEDDTATIAVQESEVDRIPDRTLFQLVFLPDGEEAGGDPVTYGRVVKRAAR